MQHKKSMFNCTCIPPPKAICFFFFAFISMSKNVDIRKPKKKYGNLSTKLRNYGKFYFDERRQQNTLK